MAELIKMELVQANMMGAQAALPCSLVTLDSNAAA